MGKFRPKKQSKQGPARKGNKIEKKVGKPNKKLRKDAKRDPQSQIAGETKILPVGPSKEDVLKAVEAMKKQHDEEKQMRREEAKQKRKEELAGGLQGLVKNAESKHIQHELNVPDQPNLPGTSRREENSLKAYYKEFKKVLDSADVILEVVDARDPLGTRCDHVEEAVKAAKGNKKLVLVLNKADLVPRENLDQWLKYLRSSLPSVAFKASTQDQSKKLGRKKLGFKSEDMIQSSTCFGAELLLSLLGNYCRNKGGVKSSIRVGIVGLPNVGKSSIINSLKRSKACNVGSTPGITKAMQAVQLDSKIKLLDSPGIVFAGGKSENANDSSVALKNAVKIQALKDPFTPATAILKRISKQQIMELYDMCDFATPDEFFAKKALKMGMFKKGGVPDVMASARSILNDWNSGKIRYYTVPPETAEIQVSATIVSKNVDEFDIEKFAADEQMMLDSVAEESAKTMGQQLVGSEDTGSAVASEDKRKEFKLQKMNEKQKKKEDTTKNSRTIQRKKKVEPLFEIEGNQKLNKVNKMRFKKQKKERVRRDKEATNLADQFNNFSLGGDLNDCCFGEDSKMTDESTSVEKIKF